MHVRLEKDGKTKKYCHSDATFSAQTGTLADINTVEGY